MKVLFLLISLCLSVSVSAFKTQELETLNRALSEILAIDPLIEQAIHRADQADRFAFNYAYLRTDLNIIKQGLRLAVHDGMQQQRYEQYPSGEYGTVGRTLEAESIQKILHELQALNLLYREAMLQGKQNQSRKRINYTLLSSDLSVVIYGLQQALLGAGDTPRRFTPLKGLR